MMTHSRAQELRLEAVDFQTMWLRNATTIVNAAGRAVPQFLRQNLYNLISVLRKIPVISVKHSPKPE